MNHVFDKKYMESTIQQNNTHEPQHSPSLIDINKLCSGYFYYSQ